MIHITLYFVCPLNFFYSLISTCGTIGDAVRERNGIQQPSDSCQTRKLGLHSDWLAGTLNDRDFVWREGKHARGEPCPWPWASCAPHRARKRLWKIHTLWAAMAWCDRAVQTLLAIVGAFAAFSLMTIAIATDYWLYSRAYICNATNATADESQMPAKKVKGDMTHSGLWRICCIEGKTKSDKFLTFITPTSFRLRTLFFGTERFCFTPQLIIRKWMDGWMDGCGNRRGWIDEILFASLSLTLVSASCTPKIKHTDFCDVVNELRRRKIWNFNHKPRIGLTQSPTA